MSFYKDASLVFLPSGGAGKDTKAYSIKPTDGSGDFTFSRGSNLTATRIDSNGLIAKGRENLLKQSNNFGDTAWIQSQTTRSSGEEGYDGTSDAWEIVRASGGGLALYQMITNNSGVNTALSGVNTFSIYVKVNSSNGIGLAFASTSVMAQFDISDDSKTSAVVENGIIASTQEYVGNNFYRLSVTADTTASNVRLYTLSANGASVSVSGATYIIQDAQTEIGLVATEYIESGASTGLAGILEDSPRFDYSGGASCPSLLLEPSRTNLVEYSEYMLGSNWLGGQTSITPLLSPDLSPEGKLNAYRITRTSTNTQLGSLSTVTSGQTYTGSIYIKRVSGSYNARIKVVENTSTTIDITDEWKRFDLTEVATSSNGRLYISPFSTGDVIDVFGAQLEEGSYPTSYIPNHSGGSVTREFDYSESSTSLSIGDSEFCAYYEMDAKEIPRESFITFFRIEFGSSSHFIGLKGSSDTTNNIYTLQTLGNYSETMGNVTQAGVVKFLINYSSGTGDLFVNGTKYDAVISGPTTGNTISNVELWGSGYAHDSKQILLFPTALSDNQCIALTS